jgi:hypothetical protein
MSILKTYYCTTYKLLREREKSRERGRGQRAATSEELRESGALQVEERLSETEHRRL